MEGKEENLFEFEEKRMSEGFFPKVHKKVCETMGEANIDKLEEIKEDIPTLLQFTHDLECYKNCLEIKEFYPEKNQYESKAKKDYANKAYQQGKDVDALYLYTQAIILCPVKKDGTSRELAICLANRSAVLFSLKAYSMALDDIKLAFEVGYPDELAYKLYDRKAKILVLFKQMADAEEAYKNALKYVDKASKLSSDKKKHFQKEVSEALAIFKKAPSNFRQNDESVVIYPKQEVPKIDKVNKLYPAMADAVTFKYEVNRGRFAIANRDITVGEIVAVEKAVVSHMLPEYMGKNCTHCFKVMKAPYPCFTCTKVMFCSYNCRKVAMETYHKYECKLVDLFLASGMSIICFLAYRSITQKSLSWFLKNRDSLMNHNERNGETQNQEKIYKSDDYENYFNLVSHHTERKTGDIFQRAMFCIFLVKCLKSQNYFPNSEKDVLSKDELYIAELFSHLLEVLQFNSHEIAQFEMLKKDSAEGATSKFIGAGIYPTLAMMNHSCDPCIVRYYVEDYVIVQAIKNIYKGEEITENYGPIFFYSSKDDRQNRLYKQYWFNCQCVACQENWPTMHEMTQDVLNFRCNICGGTVPFHTSSNIPQLKCSCGTNINLFKGLKDLADTELLAESANSELQANHLESAQLLYTEYLKKLDAVLAPPYPDYYKIQQNIWKCIWMRHGNRVIIPNQRKTVVQQEDDYDTLD